MSTEPSRDSGIFLYFPIIMIIIFITIIISNGNRTEWSPIQSVIIGVINKIAGVRFV